MLDFSNPDTYDDTYHTNEKLQILNKTYLDEVDLAFDVGALRVLAARYLLRDEKGMIIESPKQMFERIAILVACSDILHDERVYDINGAQVKHGGVGAEVMGKISIGKYELNRYHLEAFARLYNELNDGHMKAGPVKVVTMLADGEFNDYEILIRRYYDLMVSKDFLPNTPTLMNAGAPLGQLSACFVLDIKDDMAAIMDTAKDVAMIFKSGGGVGINYSKLRPEGDQVSSTSGVASGPLSFMKVIDAVTGVVKQGGKRRGANMGIMNYNHPDIKKFINCKTTAGELENFNISVGTDASFWEAINEDSIYTLTNPRNGDVPGGLNARQVLNLIAECAWKSAEPGLIFFDNINRLNPLITQKGPLNATNPCFHPETLIETVKGPMKIKDITEDVRVYTCDKDGRLTTRMASKSWVSRKNTETLKLTLNNGRELIVTPDHKLLSRDLQWLEARDVHIKTRLVGLCRTRRGARYIGIRLTSEDPRGYRMEHRFVYEQTSQESIPKSIDVHHIDGNTHNNCVTNLMKIPHREHARLTAYTQPNNHQVRNELGNFIESGRHGAKVIINVPEELSSRFPGAPSIVKIEEGPITDVYDLSVEDTHCVIANGIVAHNCGEQSLYPYESCNLGSINLSNFVKDGEFEYERFDQVVRLCTRFLDNVIDVNKYPLEHINVETKKTRRIGLGIMGLADALFKLDIAYNSEAGYTIMNRLAERLSWHSMQESSKLAKERGSYPLYDAQEFANHFPVAGAEDDEYWRYLKGLIAQYGIRNAWTTTIAPTGTLSMIAGCSSGVEPAFGLAFEKHVTVGKFKYTNEIFRTVLEDRLLYADEDSLSKPTCWNRDLFDSLYGEIVANHGSCQGLWQVPKNIQRVFVTAMDIHWADHIYAEAVWQKWISNAIAKTINMPGSATVDDVKRAYLIAHELGLKGITVYRDGSRAAQVLHVSGDKTYQTAQPSAAVKKALSNLRDNEYIASEIRAVVEDIWAPRVEKLADGLSIIHYTGSEPTADFSTALTTELWFRQQRTTTSGVYPCPTCNMPLIIQDGCKSCKSCGWSACSS